tara:strand:+ start:122 stop:838 length:717 start_codon:yes stop_codon:yes gene_type:complete
MIQPVTFVNTMDFITKSSDKKIITISPGGLAGFYMLGVITYIKENYDTRDVQILGASAGAWNTLPMLYKGSITEIVDDILHHYNDKEISSMYDLQCGLKELIIQNYQDADFDLQRANFATTAVTKSGFEQVILTDITTLEQAVDCCFASSHIPFITGKVIHKINNKNLFDGGFINFPPKELEHCLNIAPNMWKSKTTESLQELLNINNILKFRNYYSIGYDDSKTNKLILDNYLTAQE